MKRCLLCQHRFTGATWICPDCGAAPEVVDGVPMLAPELAIEGDGYDSHWFDALVAVEERNWWFRSRNRLILQTLHRSFPAARSVLEIGCGTGYVLRALSQAGYQTTGSELFPRGIEHARTRTPDATFVQLDARALPYREAFDIVAAFDVIEHIAEDQLVVNEMAAAARPGGGVVITVPQHPWLWSQADDYAHHQRRYSRAGLTARLERACLKPVLMTSFVTVALPAMAAARGLERRSTAYDPMAEFGLPRWLNGVLEGFAAVERQLIRAGISLPVGGSLLAVAIKD
jgi:SAM-dependent methyltransferase